MKSSLEKQLYMREYEKNNKERLTLYRKDYYKKTRRKQLTDAAKRQANYRNEILSLLGGKCKMCNYDTDSRALQVDHVNSDGTEHRKSLSHNPQALLKDIKNDLERFQLLCANCNWIKRYTHRELYGKR